MQRKVDVANEGYRAEASATREFPSLSRDIMQDPVLILVIVMILLDRVFREVLIEISLPADNINLPLNGRLGKPR